jgi:hypothetical protein
MLLQYVQTSYDQPTGILAVNIPKAQAMRNAADALDKKDREIEFARNVLKYLDSLSYPEMNKLEGTDAT